jgi:two-component system, chemotaxis family, CheB/CheR fusion protein
MKSLNLVIHNNINLIFSSGIILGPAKMEDKAGKEKKESFSWNDKNDFFPIIGIGASAGGLEAIENFLSGTPSEPNVAVVIIQHLSPDHSSMMTDLLKKHTRMEITTVKDKDVVEPNHVYLNPPDKEVSIYNGVLRLEKPNKIHRSRTPIDHFFRSLAEDQESRAIGIILSGSGSDGTLGLKEIRGAGGITIVQDPSEAKYDLMPRSALASDSVDFSLKASAIFDKIQEYIKNPYVRGHKKLDLTHDQYQKHFNQIFNLIRKCNGHDFSQYKPTTVRRRIERRLALHKIDDLKTYVRYLRENPREVTTLFKELLIKVTSFFRDPEAFEALKKEALRDLIMKNQGDNLRIWVPACASGEEAYSIAILTVEVMRELDKHISFQVFATDIDEEAIETARMGEYPASISLDVSDERLNKFFSKNENTYRLKKDVREKIVFAVQNVIKDAPFSKLDLISCRNLLIYMESELQNKLIPLFHYSLKEGGYLFLGSSETVGPNSDLFVTADSKYKIFKAKNGRVKEIRHHPPLPFTEILPENQAGETKQQTTYATFRSMVQNVIINDYSPPGVLINEDFEIVYFSGSTEKFLLPPSGDPSFNLFNMARQGLRHNLSTKMRQAIKEKNSITCEKVPIQYGDKIIPTDVILRPLGEIGYENNLFLILFREIEAPEDNSVEDDKREPEEDEGNEKVKKLREELQSVRQYYQSALEELQVTNEELRASNEELQSTNEEFQSTNEEHETAKEELQSTNEELSTVNAELDNKVEQLEQSYSDMNNLLASTEIGTLFLDKDLKIKRFTPSIRKIFNLIPEDVGRPLSDIASKIPYGNITREAEEVLETLNRKEVEVRTDEGNWFSLRILPYRTSENVIDGVVLTFIDMSRLIKTKSDFFMAQKASVFEQEVINIFRESILILNKDMKIKSANRSFYDIFGISPKETENKGFYELSDGVWDISNLKKSLNDILNKKSFFKNLEVKLDLCHGRHKILLINAQVIGHEENKDHIILAMEDITEGEK